MELGILGKGSTRRVLSRQAVDNMIHGDCA